jgi:hypothetical protein
MARSSGTMMSGLSSSSMFLLLIIILVTVLVIVLAKKDQDQLKPPVQGPGTGGTTTTGCPSIGALPSSFGAVAKGDVGVMSYDNLVPGEQQIFPDGLVSTLPSRKQPGQYVAIWSEALDYRSVANTPRIEQHIVRKPHVYGYSFCQGQSFPYYTSWSNGGQWIIWVRPLPNNPDRWIGLVHTESGINSAGECIGGGQPAFKLIAITYSNDEGKTWEPPKQIIKIGNQIPNTWGGIGDNCGLYVCQTKTWYCYFGGPPGMGIARSLDPEAKAGTWQVYLNGNWVDALSAQSYSLLGISNKNSANPNVFYSTFYNAYVMILWPYESGSITMAISQDGLNWSPSVNISIEGEGLGIPPIKGHPLFPFVIGSNGHLEVGKAGVLYYAVWDDRSWRRMKYRTIEFR